MAAPEPSKPGLYVHVPFCSSICNYCNFTRGLFDEHLKQRFVSALLVEMGPHSSLPIAPDTLYFGGGTPSLLAGVDVTAIVQRARDVCGLTADAEITLEANPESVSPESLEQFREAGVNRLSFGVQSFRDDELARLGRQHSVAGATRAIRYAREAGFENISLDLMMWLPTQTVASWLSSVEMAIDVGPDHMSLYILEVYPHLPLKQEIDRHQWAQETDDAAAEMYVGSMALLENAGFEQYEISNVCRPGRESRHNLKYWSDGEWLGFGPGAHSTADGTRWRNVSSTEDYIERIAAGESPAVDRRVLPQDERLGDALFTGLRLTRGVDLDAVSRRYAVNVWDRFGGSLTPFLDAGILCRRDGRLILTRQGMLVANEVMSVFV